MRVYSIDAFKIIAAFLVVSLHVNCPIERMDAVIGDIARIAVPYFFMVSGFFYKREKTHSTIIRMVYYLLVAMLLYFFAEWYLYKSLHFACNEFCKVLQYRFWVCNEMPFCPVAWYLSSYIYILAIAYIVKSEKVLYVIGLISLLFALCIGSYSHLLGIEGVNSLMWSTCFISVFCWFSIGLFLKKNTVRFCARDGILLLLFVMGLIMSIGEHYLLKRLTNAPVTGVVYLGTIISTVSLFVWLMKYPQLGRRINVNKLPLFIFLSHVAIYYVYVSLFCPSKFELSYPPLVELPFPSQYLVNSVMVFFTSCLLYYGCQSVCYYLNKISYEG